METFAYNQSCRMGTRVGSCWQSSGEDWAFPRPRKDSIPSLGNLDPMSCAGGSKGTERERKEKRIKKLSCWNFVGTL